MNEGVSAKVDLPYQTKYKITLGFCALSCDQTRFHQDRLHCAHWEHEQGLLDLCCETVTANELNDFLRRAKAVSLGSDSSLDISLHCQSLLRRYSISCRPFANHRYAFQDDCIGIAHSIGKLLRRYDRLELVLGKGPELRRYIIVEPVF